MTPRLIIRSCVRWLVFAAWLAPVVLAPTPAAGGPLQTHVIYLPRVQYLPPGISGAVTDNGAPAAGVTLTLDLWNGTSWTAIRTATTDPAGAYVFATVPALLAGQQYRVRYSNSGQLGRLLLWATRPLAAFAGGQAYADLGAFDLADIPLVAPAPGASVALPAAFQWTRRAATPTDSYRLVVADQVDGDPYFLSGPLGYVGASTLGSLPAGFAPGARYVWLVSVESPDGGLGVSLSARSIYFSAVP